MGETIARFVLGGIIVSLFALVGSAFKPPTFAGLFGSAPSVAMATLALAFATHGRWYVATECRSMILGAVGLAAYSGACAWIVRRATLPVWAGAGLSWLTWAAVTLGLWSVLGGGAP